MPCASCRIDRQALFEATFKDWDADGDGFISRDEDWDGVMNDADVCKQLKDLDWDKLKQE